MGGVGVRSGETANQQEEMPERGAMRGNDRMEVEAPRDGRGRCEDRGHDNQPD